MSDSMLHPQHLELCLAQSSHSAPAATTGQPGRPQHNGLSLPLLPVSFPSHQGSPPTEAAHSPSTVFLTINNYATFEPFHILKLSCQIQSKIQSFTSLPANKTERQATPICSAFAHTTTQSVRGLGRHGYIFLRRIRRQVKGVYTGLYRLEGPVQPSGVGSGRRPLQSLGLKNKRKELAPESAETQGHGPQKPACPAGANRQRGSGAPAGKGQGCGGGEESSDLCLLMFFHLLLVPNPTRSPRARESR